MCASRLHVSRVIFWDRILPFSEADDEANRLVIYHDGCLALEGDLSLGYPAYLHR